MAETDPNRLIPHQGEILPPKKHTDWYATTTDYIRRPAVRWVGSLSLLGFAGYCASQFVQLRGIVNIPASRIFLYVGAIALTLLAWGIVSNLPRFRKTAAVSLALIIWIAALVIDMKSVPKSGTDKAG
jgi:hypothetical protein